MIKQFGTFTIRNDGTNDGTFEIKGFIYDNKGQLDFEIDVLLWAQKLVENRLNVLRNQKNKKVYVE